MLARTLLVAAAASGALAQSDSASGYATAPASSSAGAAAQTTAAPTGGPATTYACNPAHSYPGGSSCVVRGSSLMLVGPAMATGTGGSTGGGNGTSGGGSGGGVVTPQPSPPIATGAAAMQVVPILGVLLAGVAALFL